MDLRTAETYYRVNIGGRPRTLKFLVEYELVDDPLLQEVMTPEELKEERRANVCSAVACLEGREVELVNWLSKEDLGAIGEKVLKEANNELAAP